MSDRYTASGADIRALLPVRALRVEGELALSDDDRREIERIAGGLMESEPTRSWPSCEEQACLQFAQSKLGSSELEVEEAEPL